MSVVIPFPICHLLATLLAMVGSVSSATAGWVTLKNDTDRVVVVQCSTDASGQTRRCRPIRLLPGESIREMQAPQDVTVEVFDTQKPIKLLHSSTLKIVNEKQTFLIRVEGRIVKVNPAPSR